MRGRSDARVRAGSAATGGSGGGLATDLGVALACGAAARGADVRGAVSRFLAALPLGATAADAEVEAAVGGALTAALLARADLQRKLGAWRAPAAAALRRRALPCGDAGVWQRGVCGRMRGTGRSSGRVRLSATLSGAWPAVQRPSSPAQGCSTP